MRSSPPLVTGTTDVFNDERDAHPIGLVDRLSTWALGGPLTMLVLSLCAFALASWIPAYLRWPWWIDHDTFAALAHAWDLGEAPYRDLHGHNFPGAIYLCWALGKLFGWGKTWTLYAADSAFLLSLGVVMLAWSRDRFGGLLAGAVGFAGFVWSYLGLPYSQVAQRDWHASHLAICSILVLQMRLGRWKYTMAAGLFALGLAFRPQVVWFLPAVALSIDESVRRPGERFDRSVIALLAWLILLGAFTILAFAPLAWAGVFDEFIRSIRTLANGPYSRLSPWSACAAGFRMMLKYKVLLVTLAMVLLGPTHRRLVLAWAVAMLGSFGYRILNPVLHDYLMRPVELVYAVELAVLSGLILDLGGLPARVRTAMVLAVLSTASPDLPAMCRYRLFFEEVGLAKPGKYARIVERNGSAFGGAPYPWVEYYRLLEYLREQTPPDIRVVNLLKAPLAITGAAGRRPGLPAESELQWLALVSADYEEDFVEYVERHPDSVVVWIPDEPAIPDEHDEWDTTRHAALNAPKLRALVRRLYEPDRRFGTWEVWRRRPSG